MGSIALHGVGKRFNLRRTRLIASDAPADEAEDDGGDSEAGEEGGRRAGPASEKWALKDITASISAGERVALVGANGAGKSTLLKTIAGLSLPTEGVIRGRGRVIPINSLLAPFRPTGSGTANLRVMARTLRVERTMLEARLETIVAFSGLGEQAEQPVTTYSRGMYGRLAMAAMLHLDADILLVDDGVSVGDAGYRQAVDERLRAVIDGGATLLFASHKLAYLKDYCERALWLEDGRLREDGPAAPVLQAYRDSLLDREETALTDLSDEDTAAPSEQESGGHPILLAPPPDREPAVSVNLRLVERGEGRFGELQAFNIGGGTAEDPGDIDGSQEIVCVADVATMVPDVLVDAQLEVFQRSTLIMTTHPETAFCLAGAGPHRIVTSIAQGLPTGTYSARLKIVFSEADDPAREMAYLVQPFRVSGEKDDARLLRFERSGSLKRRPLLRPRLCWRVTSAAPAAPASWDPPE